MFVIGKYYILRAILCGLLGYPSDAICQKQQPLLTVIMMKQ